MISFADGFAGRGVLVCVLTADDHDKLRWVRRELYAACLKFYRYGTPVPVVVEAGMTVNQLMKHEEDRGRTKTPLHLVRDRVLSIRYDLRQKESDFAAALALRIREAVHREVRRRTPLFLTSGLAVLAAQLVFPAVLVLIWTAISPEYRSEESRSLLVPASLFVIAVDLFGTSVSRLLPSWAGGTGACRPWLSSVVRPVRHQRAAVFLTAVVAAALFRTGFRADLLLTLAVGLCVNLIDHELWQTRRLSHSLTNAGKAPSSGIN